MRTAARSTLSPSHPMARPSCRALATRASKYGVRLPPQPLHIQPSPHTLPFSCRCIIPGFGCREAERAQRQDQLCRLLTRWPDHRVGLRRQEPQSVGCACRPSPCTSSHQFTSSFLLQVLQPWLWSPRNRTRTAGTSTPSPSLRTARRSPRARTTTPSKCGVRLPF